ncbi:unnamed protein product, partial [Scytosiphon promiscuus]
MHVWEHRNRRHRGLARKPPRPRAHASVCLTREGQEHEQELRDEEIQRQQLEDAEIDIRQEEVRRLLMEYMDDPKGKQELDEVADNLRHWKENCNALGYDSDGEQLSQTAAMVDGTTAAMDGSNEVNEQKKTEANGERSRRRKAREVFDMFDADGSRTISTSEMKASCSDAPDALLQEMCIPMKRPELKQLMREIDTDGSGEVDFDEASPPQQWTFYRWYSDNASAARSADKAETVGLFATKLVKGLTGFTFRMEALRIIIAHAQSQVEKRERGRFRLTRPPRFVCDHCGESFDSAKNRNRHAAMRELHHRAWDAAEREATRRFHPVAVILDHTAPPLVEGAPLEPYRSPDAPTARKKRLRRLVYSDRFYILYGGVGWGGMGSGDVERVEEKRWVNKPHPRLPDPDDRRGAQLRRGQSVEGINPSDPRAKVPLEVTRGGLVPDWGGVRRGRVSKRVDGRDTIGLQHVLLRLAQEKARATNVFMADDTLARALVTFRWEGWSSEQVTLHAEFNCFKEEGMGEDQTAGRIGHQITHFLSPGTYKYFFTVDGRRRVDESLPVYCHLPESPTVLGQFTSGPDSNQRREKAEDLGGVAEAVEAAAGRQAEDGAGASAIGTPKAVDTRPNALTRIDLSRHLISDDGAVALALALRRNVRVQELDLSYNRISGEGVAALASSLGDPRCRVSHVSLSQNGIGRRGGEHLGRMLAGGDGTGRWGQVPCLQELILADNMLGDDGAEDLAAGLYGHPCLKHLVLDGNDIGHDGTQSLCEALLQNTSLRTLSLRRNSLLADSAQARRQKSELAGLLSRNGAIEGLDLAFNPVGPEGLRRLSGFLPQNTRLETLGLRGCEAQADGVKSGVYTLAQGLCSNHALTSLDLAANELDEYAAQELAHALVKNKTLTAIDLTGNCYLPDEWLREHHKICSEVYDTLPSLAESLRLNRVRRDANGTGANRSGFGGKASPRTVQREKTRARVARAAERNKRRSARRKREFHVRNRHGGKGATVPKHVAGGSGVGVGGFAGEGQKSPNIFSGEEDPPRGKRRRRHARSNTRGVLPTAVGEAGPEARVGGDGAEKGAASESKRSTRKPFADPSAVTTTAAAAAARASKTRIDEPSPQLSVTPVDGVAAASASSPSLGASGAEKAAADGALMPSEGIRRAPGVWTRRGVWAPANELAEDRDRVLRELFTRAREDAETGAVREAGEAKRDELLAHLNTPEGEVLVARVAKLLVHAEREEARAAERTRKAELRALRLEKKKKTTWGTGRQNGDAGTRGSTGGGVSTLTQMHSLWLTAPWTRSAKSQTLGEARAPAAAATADHLPGSALAGSRSGSPGPRLNDAAGTANPGWDSPLSEGGGSCTTLGGLESLASSGTAASSLPSATAAAAMEEEDQLEIQRALGALREDKKVWDLKHRPPFLRAFGRFDPEGRGDMLASDIGDLMAQLLLPEAVRPEEVTRITAELTEISDQERKADKAAAERAARRSGLHQAPPPPRPFTLGGGGKTVGMAVVWRWHRREHMHWKPSFTAPSRKELRGLASQQRRRERSGEVARDWARRVVLAVGEREARLESAERFRGHHPPRFVCPLCHEFGSSTQDGLDEHVRDASWHDVNAALQERFEENADIVAVARRAGGADSYPEYFHVARDMPEETELQVHEEPNEISRPLGTITFEMLVLAVGEEGDWLKINFESHLGVYAKHTTTTDPKKGHTRRRRVVLTRMTLPAARAAAKVAASTAHLSATATGTLASTLARPLAFTASGLSTLGRATLSTLDALAYGLHHAGSSRPPREPEALAPGTAVFKPRVVRFVLPRVFCHARGLPSGAMLKVRAEPGGGCGWETSFKGDREGAGDQVLGRIGADQCVIGLATSGDWLQVRYKKYEAAWMLMTYRGRRLLAPLEDDHPGELAIGDGGRASGGGLGKVAGTQASPFPVPAEV